MAAKSVSKSACKPYTLTRTYDLQVCRSRERAMLPLLLNKSLADFSPFSFWCHVALLTSKLLTVKMSTDKLLTSKRRHHKST
jgi:hypothetical protein